MTSGIYRLVFNNGSTYIGKSNNINRRIDEHVKKLTSGTAATKLQQAFNCSNLERVELLVECHPDHIDLMETCMIALHKPNLNSASTAIVEDMDWLIDAEYLDESTVQHLKRIRKLELDNSRLSDDNMLLEELNTALDHAEYWHEKYKEEKAKSWWSKLFNG